MTSNITPGSGKLAITGGPARWQHVREYYERHRVLLPVVIGLTLGAPFLGLVLFEWVGVLVGLMASAITFLLGLRAVTKVREIHHGGEP